MRREIEDPVIGKGEFIREDARAHLAAVSIEYSVDGSFMRSDTASLKGNGGVRGDTVSSALDVRIPRATDSQMPIESTEPMKSLAKSEASTSRGRSSANIL